MKVNSEYVTPHATPRACSDGLGLETCGRGARPGHAGSVTSQRACCVTCHPAPLVPHPAPRLSPRPVPLRAHYRLHIELLYVTAGVAPLPGWCNVGSSVMCSLQSVPLSLRRGSVLCSATHSARLGSARLGTRATRRAANTH